MVKGTCTNWHTHTHTDVHKKYNMIYCNVWVCNILLILFKKCSYFSPIIYFYTSFLTSTTFISIYNIPSLSSLLMRDLILYNTNFCFIWVTFSRKNNVNIFCSVFIFWVMYNFRLWRKYKHIKYLVVSIYEKLTNFQSFTRIAQNK